MMSFFQHLFDTSGFPPRWHCGQWEAGHGWLHILSDIAIFGAYSAIPLVLTYFIWRRKDVPFLPIFWLFAAFIVACGFSHLIEATIFWHPWYRLAGLVKLVTAVVSWTTVFALLKVLPSALALPGIAKINARLSEEIAERTRAVEALRESEASLSGVLRRSPAGIIQTDAAGRMVLVNPRWCEMLGYSEADMLGKSVFDITHPSSVAATSEAVGLLAAGGQDFQIEKIYCRKDGSLLNAQSNLTALRSPTGEFLGLIAVVLDITERLRIEEELRERSHFLQRIAQVTPGVLQVFDLAEQRTIFMNRSVAFLLGYEPDEVIAMGAQVVPSLMHPDDTPRFTEHVARVCTLPDGEIAQFEYRMRDRAGAWHWFHSHDAVFARDAEGVARQLIGVSTEVSERKRAEDELRRLASELSEGDRRKDEFLATLAHELRNPLAPIRNGLEIIAMSHDDGENDAQVRTMMQRQVAQMVHLVDDLLDVSRISQGKMVLRKQRIELADVINTAVDSSRPLMDASAHELTVQIPQDPVFLEADATRLAQVISNLLNNAAKYSTRGGRTWLTAEVQNKDVVISVKDTGIGIPADMLPTIFDMFTQVDRSLEKSQGGLGIGLSLVKRLVELHGGRIEVKSEGQDKGSEFTVRLPILASQESAQSQDDNIIVEDYGQKRILIVDDNHDSAMSLSMMIRLKGHDTQTAHDGLAAVQVAEQYRPEIVLLDIGLPKMNGYEACRCIREQPWSRGMIIVAVTGWGQDEDRRRSSEAGFDCHLVKPIDLTSLDQLLAGIGTPISSSETRTVNRDSLRILVVDDRRDARLMLSTLLTKSGHDVRTASDGPTAIASAMEFQPEVVLMDKSMPGMSGLEVARLFRQDPKLKDVFMIALTGHGDDIDREESLEAGFNHHLVKPADIKVILELLGNIPPCSGTARAVR